ncbi:hypothetical protein HK100_003850 [Physocladia obscura]|uniref:Uncharacterized protein n=1 Tax=Physocladia obscura TaxID=109957 RepID=A0AAD5XDB6_9FUNG|nr:hypothetical protein HK100_003850 [Physocladia obscura]
MAKNQTQSKEQWIIGSHKFTAKQIQTVLDSISESALQVIASALVPTADEFESDLGIPTNDYTSVKYWKVNLEAVEVQVADHLEQLELESGLVTDDDSDDELLQRLKSLPEDAGRKFYTFK